MKMTILTYNQVYLNFESGLYSKRFESYPIIKDIVINQ